jgi:hypothetical protein
MRRVPPKSTVADVPRPVFPAPNAYKSPAPAVIVQVWVGMVERMNRRTLNRFTRDIWARFDDRNLAPLKIAILRRRRALSAPFRP